MKSMTKEEFEALWGKLWREVQEEVSWAEWFRRVVMLEGRES